MAKGWTEERRRRQAETIRRTKPWEKATGPKTEEGKKRSRMNAWKHGGRSQSRKIIAEGLRLNRAFLKHVCFYIEAEKQEQKILENKRSKKKARRNKGLEEDENVL